MQIKLFLLETYLVEKKLNYFLNYSYFLKLFPSELPDPQLQLTSGNTQFGSSRYICFYRQECSNILDIKNKVLQLGHKERCLYTNTLHIEFCIHSLIFIRSMNRNISWIRIIQAVEINILGEIKEVCWTLMKPLLS